MKSLIAFIILVALSVHFFGNPKTETEQTKEEMKYLTVDIDGRSMDGVQDEFGISATETAPPFGSFRLNADGSGKFDGKEFYKSDDVYIYFDDDSKMLYRIRFY